MSIRIISCVTIFTNLTYNSYEIDCEMLFTLRSYYVNE